MIVRSYFQCATCGQAHVIRIGLGQEAYQDHRFRCTTCYEAMHIAVHLDHGKAGWRIEALENAEAIDAVDDAPVVNVDANFLVPKGERHADMAFPRITQMQNMLDAALGAAGQNPPIFRPRLATFRRPDMKTIGHPAL